MNTLLNTAAPQIGIFPTSFSFAIDKFPTTSFLVQDVSIPSIGFGRSTLNTPFQEVSFPGEKIQYNDLVIEFALDERIQNYIEIYGWMRNLSMTHSRDNYSEMVKRRQEANNYTTKSRLAEETSTAYLVARNQLNKPTFQFTFHDIFPVGISALPFSTTGDNSEVMKCSVTFAYNSFDVGRATDSVVTISDTSTPGLGVDQKFKIYAQ